MDILGLALIDKYLINKPAKKMSMNDFKDLFNTEGPYYIAKHDITLAKQKIVKGQKFTHNELMLFIASCNSNE